jgi:RHS repeat-associated protein
VHQLGGYADYDGDGDVDANDRGEITGLTCGGSNPSGACRVLDLDFDNDCDSSDETVFGSLPHTGTVIHPARRSSLLGQPFAHQGLFLDPEIGTYQNRARQYGPGLRRFVQRDPLGIDIACTIQEGMSILPLVYRDGLSMFAAEGNSPVSHSDPTGHCVAACAGATGNPTPPAATCDESMKDRVGVKCGGNLGNCNCDCPGPGIGGGSAPCKICYACRCPTGGACAWVLEPLQSGNCDCPENQCSP